MKKMGIDISYWQKGLDLKKAKEEGIEFVIVRGGYAKTEDKQFENFYKECKKLNIPVGAYWYTYATNEKEAEEEAKVFLKYLKGKKFEYPIALDIENKDELGLSKETNDSIIKAFGEVIEKAGYYFSVYTNLNFYNNHCNGKILNKKYDWWMANWAKVAYTGSNCGMTQFGGETNYIRSNKIAGKIVDQDYAYYDYPSIMKKNGLNGYSKEDRKTIDELAQEVIEGKWSIGEERKKLLKEAGYNYQEVQDRVNEILHSKKK